MSYSAHEKMVLAGGLGIAAGEFVFGVEGPFLLTRFGLNPPEAAALGTMMGAAFGYGTANFLARRRSRKHPAVETPEARDTREHIEQALSDLGARESSGLHAEVRNAKVILKGTVYSRAAEEEAEEIVRAMPGVQEVDNRLQIVP